MILFIIKLYARNDFLNELIVSQKSKKQIIWFKGNDVKHVTVEK